MVTIKIDTKVSKKKKKRLRSKEKCEEKKDITVQSGFSHREKAGRNKCPSKWCRRQNDDDDDDDDDDDVQDINNDDDSGGRLGEVGVATLQAPRRAGSAASAGRSIGKSAASAGRSAERGE